jgi:sugar lactone lactonase YvrE
MACPPSPAVSRPPRRPAPLALAALALLAGCATVKPELPQWPLPPEKPRVRFVRAFARADDMASGGALTTALRIFVPASPDAVVTQPSGLALSPDEKYLYIACSAGGRVLRADLAGGTMKIVADVEGRRPARPIGVALDGAANLYVSDSVQNVVWAYAPDGSFLRRIGGEQLEKPTGIALDRRRQLLYVLSGVEGKSERHRVEVFSLTGEHLRTIGKRGPGPGEFNFPTNVAVGPDGNLYVVDMLNFRIQAFDPEGQLVSMFGTIGAGQPGTFNKAKALAFDAFGNIYVVDSEQGYVQLFNAKFQSLMAFGGRAKLPGYMLVPTAIVIDSKNSIFVADYAAGTVNEYRLINTTAADSEAAPGDGQGAGAPSPSEKPQVG